MPGRWRSRAGGSRRGRCRWRRRRCGRRRRRSGWQPEPGGAGRAVAGLCDGDGIPDQPGARVAARRAGPTTASPDEVAEIFVLPMATLLDPAAPERRVREFRGRDRHFWVWPHERHYIWGATAAILVHLAARLRSRAACFAELAMIRRRCRSCCCGGSWRRAGWPQPIVDHGGWRWRVGCSSSCAGTGCADSCYGDPGGAGGALGGWLIGFTQEDPECRRGDTCRFPAIRRPVWSRSSDARPRRVTIPSVPGSEARLIVPLLDFGGPGAYGRGSGMRCRRRGSWAARCGMRWLAGRGGRRYRPGDGRTRPRR